MISFVFCLFVTQIPREPLNGFALNQQGRRVWSLARTSLNVKVKAQGSRSPGTKPGKLLIHPHWQCIVTRTPCAGKVQQETEPFRGHRGWRGDDSALWPRPACGVCFMKTYLALFFCFVVFPTIVLNKDDYIFSSSGVPRILFCGYRFN